MQLNPSWSEPLPAHWLNLGIRSGITYTWQRITRSMEWQRTSWATPQVFLQEKLWLDTESYSIAANCCFVTNDKVDIRQPQTCPFCSSEFCCYFGLLCCQQTNYTFCTSNSFAFIVFHPAALLVCAIFCLFKESACLRPSHRQNPFRLLVESLMAGCWQSFCSPVLQRCTGSLLLFALLFGKYQIRQNGSKTPVDHWRTTSIFFNLGYFP